MLPPSAKLFFCKYALKFMLNTTFFMESIALFMYTAINVNAHKYPQNLKGFQQRFSSLGVITLASKLKGTRFEF